MSLLLAQRERFKTEYKSRILAPAMHSLALRDHHHEVLGIQLTVAQVRKICQKTERFRAARGPRHVSVRDLWISFEC
jgi:hypothetical protein